MRVFRVLSLNGIPRAEARALLRAGRVTVGGASVRDGNGEAAGVLFLDGEALRSGGHVHLMMYKPAGVLTATEDGKCETVFDLLPERLRRVGLGPVGRLDKDATGLLLLTTDGQLAHRLIHPKWEKEKVYIAETDVPPDKDAETRFASGVALSDFTAKPARLTRLGACQCEVVVSEGKFHQVKRMLGAVGCKVTCLTRVRVAGLSLDPALAPGAFRPLAEDEIRSLYESVNLDA